MKRLACLLVTFCLVLGILLIAVADVNHGHGPGHVVEEGGHGETTDDHGENAGDQGGEAQDHGALADSHSAPAAH